MKKPKNNPIGFGFGLISWLGLDYCLQTKIQLIYGINYVIMETMNGFQINALSSVLDWWTEPSSDWPMSIKGVSEFEIEH